MEPLDWLRQIPLSTFQQAVLDWYAKHQRDLPWRRTSDSYAIWVSEVMLQQTQIATVLPYYERFLLKYPTVWDLAEANDSDLLHFWQGLGYYRRAQNLLRAARQVVAQYQGQIPADPVGLRALPGLGQYTANAILCFAQGQCLPILEANTIRLWLRLAGCSSNPNQHSIKKQLWELAATVLPAEHCAAFNQALMDLGSVVCAARQPQCNICPLKKWCQATKTGRPTDFPPRLRTEPDRESHQACVYLECQEHVLIVQRPAQGPWAGLWELPRVPLLANERPASAAQRAVAQVLSLPITLAAEPTRIRHGIMNWKVHLYCWLGTIADSTRNIDSLPELVIQQDGLNLNSTGKSTNFPHTPPRQARWVACKDINQFAFSSPQRRLLNIYRAASSRTEQRNLPFDEP